MKITLIVLRADGRSHVTAPVKVDSAPQTNDLIKHGRELMRVRYLIHGRKQPGAIEAVVTEGYVSDNEGLLLQDSEDVFYALITLIP